ncbi:MAG: ankyrin repeat domain-containing protein [Azoarcus sp.]|jgi:ankyrin repeat protein|nr:ankyrin repeat domain-containing protein [Azoarcus sp.]
MPTLFEIFRPAGVGNAVAAVFAAVTFLAAAPALADDKEAALTAARRGDTGTLAKLLERRAVPPDAVDRYGNSLLILAVREGNIDAVDTLLRFKPQLDRRNRNGDSALMMAAMQGHEKLIERLLAAGASVNNGGWTALHYAALEGKLAIVERLLAAGADVNALTPNLSDALMLAGRNGHINVVRRLLKTPIALDRRNDHGMDAEAWARSKGNTRIADLIEKARAERPRRR